MRSEARIRHLADIRLVHQINIDWGAENPVR
jgi:hypothetical protein